MHGADAMPRAAPDDRTSAVAAGTQSAGFAAIESEAARIARQLDIPPCPELLARFNEEYHAPEPALRRLAALIARDIGLAATLIKTVNSPFYGLTRKAGGIEQALSILGLRSSANLISGLLLRQAFPEAASAAAERFWHRTTHVAGIAAAIAVRFSELDRDEAYTYVLFRDCGMLVLLRKFAQYAEIIDQAENIPGAQFVRVEDARFKLNHARIACALARSWFLAESLCGAILCHHDYGAARAGPAAAEAPNPRLVAFGLLAEQIAALQLGRGLCPDWLAAERFVLDTLEIAADEIVALSTELRARAV